jgi:hypothetical protein
MNHLPEAESYPSTARTLARATLDAHFDELRPFSTLDDDTLFPLYKDITADPDPVYEPGNILPGARLHIACLILTLFSTPKKVAVDSWKEQLDALLTKKKMLELDGYVKTTLTEKATTDTEMILKREPTIEPAVIKSLIAEGVTDATKELKKSIERIQQSVDRSSSTKHSRGAHCASSTKKKNEPPPKKKAPRKPTDKADAPASDTSPSNGNRKKKTAPTKSTQRNKPSSKNSATRKKK